jgi:hypothetical protein
MFLLYKKNVIENFDEHINFESEQLIENLGWIGK